MVKQAEITPFLDAATLEMLQDEQSSIDEFASTALAKIIKGDMRSSEVRWLANANERVQELTEELADGQIRTFRADYFYEHPNELDTSIPEYVDPELYMHTAVHVCGEFQSVHPIAVKNKEDDTIKYILAAEIKAYVANGGYVVPDNPRSVYLPIDSLGVLDVVPENFFKDEPVERMRRTREREAELKA